LEKIRRERGNKCQLFRSGVCSKVCCDLADELSLTGLIQNVDQDVVVASDISQPPFLILTLLNYGKDTPHGIQNFHLNIQSATHNCPGK